jgi:hypothetical protein
MSRDIVKDLSHKMAVNLFAAAADVKVCRCCVIMTESHLSLAKGFPSGISRWLYEHESKHQTGNC